MEDLKELIQKEFPNLNFPHVVDTGYGGTQCWITKQLTSSLIKKLEKMFPDYNILDIRAGISHITGFHLEKKKVEE